MKKKERYYFVLDDYERELYLRALETMRNKRLQEPDAFLGLIDETFLVALGAKQRNIPVEGETERVRRWYFCLDPYQFGMSIRALIVHRNKIWQYRQNAKPVLKLINKMSRASTEKIKSIEREELSLG